MAQFQVNQKNFTSSKIVETSNQEDINIADDEIIVKVDRFAYTSNNITYAVAGDMIGYWKFFPAAGDDAEGNGVIPVWGFADVVRSNVEGVPVGDRLFGYFPPATHLVIKPVGIAPHRLIDGAAHRASLPATYNLYRRIGAEPGYDRGTDNARMLLWPLHMTSYCLWDALQDKSWYGADRVIILSASSKTSMGLAFALHQDDAAPEVIGVTSGRNVDMVKSTGLYTKTFTYDQLDQIDASVNSVIVDMSGNVEVLKSLYTSLGDHMKYCINVGITHWGDAGAKDDMLKERSEFFFAPGHIQRRLKEWGPAEFQNRTADFMKNSAVAMNEWLSYQMVDGLAGLAAIHEDVCHGKIAADVGLIVEM